MINYQGTLAVCLLAASVLLAVFFTYIYSLKRQLYLLLWTAGWSCIALYHLGPSLDPGFPSTDWQASLGLWLLAAAALLFLGSAQLYSGSKPWVLSLTAGAAVFALWAAGYTKGWIPVSPHLGVAFLFLATAWIFWRESRQQETLADFLLALGFIAWGVLRIGFAFPQSLSPGLSAVLPILVILPKLLVAVLMVMAVYEEEKRRVERNHFGT